MMQKIVWLKLSSKLAVFNLILGLFFVLFGLSSNSLPKRTIIAIGILLIASGAYTDVRQGWLAHISNNNNSPDLTYMETAVISFIVPLISLMIPLFLGWGLFIPFFILAFPFSLLGASLGYFTKQRIWVWVGSSVTTMLVLVVIFLIIYFLAIMGQINA